MSILRFREWLEEPQPIERLVLLRVCLPLAVLGFLSSRLLHADHWLSPVGFHVPDLGGDWRQPLYLAPMPVALAWIVALLITLSGLSLSLGWMTRPAAAVFALLVGYTTLADRSEAFTVNKLAPILAFALFLSPCGARYGIDAWIRQRREPSLARATEVEGGVVRFFQLFLCTMYSASGIAKARGDWLSHQVLWTHLHDQYQTEVTWLVMRALPAWTWWAMQWLVLAFEVGAPLWFAMAWSRAPALIVGLGMHTMIGLMFGPVVWFAMLMGTILIACFAPEELLSRGVVLLSSVGGRRPSSATHGPG